MYYSVDKFPEIADFVKVKENPELNGVIKPKDNSIGHGEDYSNRDEVY